MWQQIYTKTYSNVDRVTVWQKLTDINRWPTWHDDLEYCRLNGSFSIGNSFILKPKNMRPVTIKIVELNEGYSFTDCTCFFGAKMFDTHALEETPDGLKLTNTLVVAGPLKWLWIKLVAQHVANTIPQETETLINLSKAVHHD